MVSIAALPGASVAPTSSRRIQTKLSINLCISYPSPYLGFFTVQQNQKTSFE